MHSSDGLVGGGNTARVRRILTTTAPNWSPGGGRGPRLLGHPSLPMAFERKSLVVGGGRSDDHISFVDACLFGK